MLQEIRSQAQLIWADFMNSARSTILQLLHSIYIIQSRIDAIFDHKGVGGEHRHLGSYAVQHAFDEANCAVI
jgi:hypothetical protein